MMMPCPRDNTLEFVRVQTGSVRPHQQDRRLRALIDSLHHTMARYGYELVETPIVQPADLFLTKAGDRIVSQLFTFERHGRQLALRPEFTATAAMEYAGRPAGDSDVVRWQFSGPIFFEDASPDSLHAPRISVGAEMIGIPGPLAEAEVIAMAIDGLEAQEVGDWRLDIGHVGLMRHLLSRFALDSRTERFLLSRLPELKQYGRQHVLDALGRLMLRPETVPGEPTLHHADDTSAALNTQQMLDALLDATQRNVTMGGRSRHDIVRRLLQKRQRAAGSEQIAAALDFLEAWGQINAPPKEAFAIIERFIAADDDKAQTLLADWQQATRLLVACGVLPERIHIRPDLARSWDYYTGIVFEIYAAGERHIAGGGRYDELIALVGGERPVPAVGFVYYPDQLLAALPEAPDDTLTVALLAEPLEPALSWAQALRYRNITVATYAGRETIPGNSIVLTIGGDDEAVLDGRRFTPADIDQLVTELLRADR